MFIIHYIHTSYRHTSYIHTYTYIHIHTHTYTYIHIHYTYIHIHTHTYTYIHIHTHTYTWDIGSDKLDFIQQPTSSAQFTALIEPPLAFRILRNTVWYGVNEVVLEQLHLTVDELLFS